MAEGVAEDEAVEKAEEVEEIEGEKIVAEEAKEAKDEAEEGVVAVTVEMNRHPTFWMKHPSPHWDKK